MAKLLTESVKGLLSFCENEKETSFIENIIEGSSIEDAGVSVGVTPRTSYRILKRIRLRAAVRGFAPEHHMVNTVPETHFVKGVSALYRGSGANGEPILQWVKSSKNAQDVSAMVRGLIDAMVEEVPRYKNIASVNVNYADDCLAVYPIGDPHLGLLSCYEETGEDTTLESAASDLYAAMARLVKTLPHCKEALIINTGDFFHMDDTSNKTKRHGHQLDVSTNWPILLKVAIKTFRMCIDTALEHHEYVTVFNVPGNHDDHSAMILSACLSAAYESNDRVTINTEPKDYFAYRFGKNLIGAYHGHNIKKERLPLLMANEWSSDWGETEHRVWYTGHVHHDTVHEFDGCTVETVRTLSAKDRYSVNAGYHSHRDMKAVLHHYEHGPIERHTVTIKMAREYKESLNIS